MARLIKKWPISPTTEIIFLSIGGIMCAAGETTFVNVHDNLSELWNTPFSEETFSRFMEYLIKSILSYVIIGRSMIVHVYILFYFFVLWASVFEEKPLLLIPWLIASFIKNFLSDFISLMVGLTVCVLQGTVLPVCIEFLLIQCSQIAFSGYLWLSILCLYHELTRRRRPLTPEEEAKRWEELKARRRKCKSLTNECSFSSNTSNENIDAASDTEAEIDSISDISRNVCTRSLDSLVNQLHYDWDMVDSFMLRRYDETPDDPDIKISLAERAARFLRLSMDDINLVKRERQVKRTGKIEVGTQVNTLSRKFLESRAKMKHSPMNMKNVIVNHARIVPPSPQMIINVTGPRCKSADPSKRCCRPCHKRQQECTICPSRENS